MVMSIGDKIASIPINIVLITKTTKTMSDTLMTDKSAKACSVSRNHRIREISISVANI